MFKFCSRKGREFQRYPPCLVTLSLTAIKSLTQHTLIVKCRWHYLDKPVLSRAHQVLLDIPLLKFGGPGQYLYKISFMFPRSRSAGATGNDFMQVWTNLCYREYFCKTNCWQDLHFEFSRQNLNRNVQSPSMWWWLITQPKPIWKKAPPGLRRPSHTESTSGLTSSTPMVRTHTLDPTPDAPRSYNTPSPFDY